MSSFGRRLRVRHLATAFGLEVLVLFRPNALRLSRFVRLSNELPKLGNQTLVCKPNSSPPIAFESINTY